MARSQLPSNLSAGKLYILGYENFAQNINNDLQLEIVMSLVQGFVFDNEDKTFYASITSDHPATSLRDNYGTRFKIDE
ncbi:hypothetical protein TSAR_002416 [Trichomalopsis sarcophagae]|uniref:Uncharacterized protein n=1 Tax=Trichomalopsis sarcophagae TaxID=543379 RepID=A0A232EX43_9HYME|nr:hypothetical protein TSAR_002416 [Trichomalopsis sarcophagae]